MQWSKRVKKRKASTPSPAAKPKLPVRSAGSKIKPPRREQNLNADGYDWPAMVEMVYGNPYFTEKHGLFRGGSDEADEEELMGEADGWQDSRLE